MKVVDVVERSVWDAFQIRQPWAQFTQSWTWGEFRRHRGCEVRRFALVSETGDWRCAIQMEYRSKPLVGGYWFAPRGPVFAPDTETAERVQLLSVLIEGIRSIGVRKAFFVRCEPMMTADGAAPLQSAGWQHVPFLNPASTSVLDLSPDEHAMLAAMHPKTRYNIRVAERHGVTVRVTTDEKDVDAFLRLMEQTMRRDGFVHHTTYIRDSFLFLQKAGMARLRVAEHEGKMLAANIETMFGKTATYLHGASSSEERQLMAPFALQWDAIRAAIRENFLVYDFWGANPLDSRALNYKASLEGVTRFKRGWGGRQVDLCGTWDLPSVPWMYGLAFWRRQHKLV